MKSESMLNGVDAKAGAARRGALAIVATALLAVGVVMVASTTASLDHSIFDPGWLTRPFGRQLVFSAVALVVMLAMSRLAPPLLDAAPVRRWGSILLFAVAVIGLVGALIPGLAHVQRSSGRWIQFAAGGLTFGFQPSELVKPAVVVLLAYLMAERGVDPRSFRRCFAPAVGVVAACVFLIGKEDFGTSILVSLVAGSMFIVAGCRWRHLLAVAGLGAVGLAGLLVAAPYRMARLTAFSDIWADPRGAGYQPIQSLAAIASGGWLGTGLGAGLQKYGYLPECHTDFVFAIICEETGALGGGLVILLYTLLVCLGLRTMLAAPTRFERLVAFGLTATIGLQAAMNMAVVTVLAPTTGISLPLVSAGGSGTLTFAASIGAVAAIAARARTRAAAP